MEPRYRYAIYDMSLGSIPAKDHAIDWLNRVAAWHGFKVEASVSHDFAMVEADQPYSISFILSSSHAFVHTSPEHNWVEVVFASCSRSLDPRDLEYAVKDFWKPEKMFVTYVEGKAP